MINVENMTLHELMLISRSLATESHRARSEGSHTIAADCRRLSRLFALQWAMSDSLGYGTPNRFTATGEECLNELLRRSDYDDKA